MYKIFNEDCLEGMKSLPDGSVDVVIADPPFVYDTYGLFVI